MASSKHSDGIELETVNSEGSRSIIEEPQTGEDPLLDSVRSKKKLQVIRNIIQQGQHPHDINQLYRSMGEVFNLLNYAARRGSRETVQLLIESGVAVASSNGYPSPSPLETAVEYGYIEVAQLLVEKGAPVDAKLFSTVVKEGYEEVAMDMFRHHGLKLLRNKIKDKISTLTCGREENTPFRELIRHMPDLAKMVLDKCVVEGRYKDNHYNRDFEVAYNYEFLEDFRDNKMTDLPPDALSDSEGENEFIRVTTKSPRKKTWGPYKFTKHNHPLSIMVRHKREVLLNHPVVSSLIHYKWRIYGVLSYILNIVFYSVFLFFLTSYALVIRSPVNNTCLPMFSENATVCPELGESARVYPAVAAAFLLIVAFTKFLLELFQLFSQKIYYFTELSNWIEPVLFPCSILFASMPNWACPCVFPWQWQLGAFAVCLAWIDFILFTSKIPKIGIYVLMFVEICKTFTKLALLTLLLVVTFGLTFFMIFSDPGVTRSTFGTGFRALIRTLVMTTGEMEYDGIFRLDSSPPGSDGPELPFVYTAYILWVPFVIMMPVLFANLLTGLAVGDTDKVQDEAEFRLLAQVVDQVLTIEEWLPSFFKRWIQQRKTKSRRNVVKPNKKRNLRKKAIHSIKFFGWKGRYETLDAVDKVLCPHLEDLEQVKNDVQEMKVQLKTLCEQISVLATEHTTSTSV